MRAHNAVILHARDGKPYASFGGRPYASLAALTDAHPSIQDDLERYCATLLHFYPGPGCRLIESPEAFCTRYRALIAHGEAANTPVEATLPADFGPYDVSTVAAPRVENGKLVFYAEQCVYAIPYRIEADWPVKPGGKVAFELLPLVQ